MGSYIIKRILIAIPILFGITLIAFLMNYLAPGSVADMMVTPDMGPDIREALYHSMGLDSPWYVQYGSWLNNILHGNLGFSLSLRLPVSRIISERVLSTFILVGSSLVISILLAIPLGIFSAVKADTLPDRIIATGSYVFVSTPNFFVAMALIYLLTIQLRLLPSSGMYTIGMKGNIPDLMQHLVMPGLTLGIVTLGRLTRYIRTFMLDVLQQDYLRTAAAKGVPPLARVFTHAFRNAFLPLITLISLEIPTLFGGSVVVEQIFSWPGVGRMALDAINGRDYPVIMGVTLITAVLVVLSNILSDVICSLTDPRLKY
jgi:peptide/nickel transport system permease protein